MSSGGPKLRLLPRLHFVGPRQEGRDTPIAGQRAGDDPTVEEVLADPRSDDDLMLLARAQVPAAFSELVARHQQRALRVASRQLGPRAIAAAADVVQNTFIDIYRALPRYQPRGQFGSYLFRILLNQCRIAQRAARIEAKHQQHTDLAPAAAPPHESAVLARERERDTEAALARLGAKLRDVVVLRYTGELSYDEIARALEIPIGTVKRRLFDAMKKLRQLMEPT
jgi:RNA polymerase sigma factor (sigma-70 family)